MKKLAWIIFGIGVLLMMISGVFLLTQTQPIISDSVQVVLNLTPAVDIGLAVEPPQINSPVGRTVAYVASVTSVNGFAGEVVFSVIGVPEGVTVTMLPSDTLTLGGGETRGIQIDLGIPLDNGLVGVHTLTVTAESTVYN